MKYIKSRYSFINERNMDMAKSIMKKKTDSFEKLKSLLSKNIGYIGKFTDYLMNENIPYDELEKLYLELIALKEKNHPIDISQLSYEKVLDKIKITKNEVSINSFASQFPSLQKSIIKDLGNSVKNILLICSQKPNTDVFISKVSRYKDEGSLLNALKIFSKNSDNNKEHIQSLLKDKNSKIIYDDKNILIINIDNYEDMKLLGSDTSWCIVPSITTYNNYTKGRFQFIILNYNLDSFDPKFKIGLTLTDDGVIYAAHDIVDHSVSSFVRELFQENSIDFKSIIPEKEPFIFDLKNITSNTSTAKLKEIAKMCEIKDIIPVIQKLASTKKREDAKSTVFHILFRRLYIPNEISYVLKSDLVKISKEFFLLVYRSFKEIIIDEESADSKLNEAAFLKGIETWNAKAYATDKIYSKDIRKKLSIDVIKKLANKLNDIYKNNLLKFEDFNIRNVDFKGYKLSKHFEGNMLICNALIGKLEETPDYDKLITLENSYAFDSRDLIKLPIDINDYDYGLIGINDVPQVIKKDYTSCSLYITHNNINLFLPLIKHLEGYKLQLKIRKDELRKIVSNPDKYNPDGINNKIINILNQFNIKRLVSGKIISDGGLSIKVV